MAWIKTIGPDEATGLLSRLYRDAIKRAGKVFNVLRVQSRRPHTLAASVRLYTEVMKSERSSLTHVQREMLATVVSRANGCEYWVRAHGADLREEVEKAGGDTKLADIVMRDYTEADLSEQDRLMNDFACKLTNDPKSVTKADLGRLREVGFDDDGIHDIVQVTSLFAYYNRIADGLGIDDEPDW